MIQFYGGIPLPPNSDNLVCDDGEPMDAPALLTNAPTPKPNAPIGSRPSSTL